MMTDWGERYKRELELAVDKMRDTVRERDATIQQLEALNKGLDAELEMYRSIAEREGAEIAVSQLSQEQAKVKQLEARVKVLEKQLSERLEDGTKILSES